MSLHQFGLYHSQHVYNLWFGYRLAMHFMLNSLALNAICSIYLLPVTHTPTMEGMTMWIVSSIFLVMLTFHHISQFLLLPGEGYAISQISSYIGHPKHTFFIQIE